MPCHVCIQNVALCWNICCIVDLLYRCSLV